MAFKTAFLHQPDNLFGSEALLIHAQYPIAILQVEIDLAVGKMFEQHVYQLLGVAGICHVCTENLDHAIKIYVAAGNMPAATRYR